MVIRPALPDEFEEIRSIFVHARQFMQTAGNPDQWRDSYPPDDLIQADITSGACHICEMDGRIQAVFSRFLEDDSTYRFIEGAWLDDAPYCAVHRVASRGERKGVASLCLQWCLEQFKNVRIDTHRDNLPMQKVLAKNGFCCCGIIYLENGDPRLAFQRHIP